MGTSTSEAIQSQIASGNLNSIYLVLGDDDYQKAEVAGEFEEAVRILSDRLGPDANRLRHELERLVLFVGNDREITLADIRDVAGPAVAWDKWAITNAIERRDTAVALRELAISLEDGVYPPMVLGQLAWLTRTRLELSEVVDAIFRTDQALKSSRGEPRILLERLVVQMCAATGGRSGRRRSVRQTSR